MAVLQFVFSSFWVFSGTVILISTVGGIIAAIAHALRGCNCDDE